MSRLAAANSIAACNKKCIPKQNLACSSVCEVSMCLELLLLPSPLAQTSTGPYSNQAVPDPQAPSAKVYSRSLHRGFVQWGAPASRARQPAPSPRGRGGRATPPAACKHISPGCERPACLSRCCARARQPGCAFERTRGIAGKPRERFVGARGQCRNRCRCPDSRGRPSCRGSSIAEAAPNAAVSAVGLHAAPAATHIA